ncbi:hypothetical protein EV356DRAFT_371618 [Viridothelium virens]|uniref:Uncharacterized protein n=1 Tax=Viridothelium virens TaxID=1048519 RepID=A0A6A6GVD4_VIRVR|nr:hypothetical protein EV356DRAFT_371618 [Viridothelium virens]
MAEIFGVVASSLEVVKTVLKLRSLWSEVKEAPATVSDLLEKAELIGNILSATEATFLSANLPPNLCHTAHVTESIALCHRAQKSLNDAAEMLDRKLISTHRFRRKLVAVKICLKKEDIERLTTKLDRAVRLLILANQHVQSAQSNYMLSQLSSAVKQPRMIGSKASTDTTLIPKPVLSDGIGRISTSSGSRHLDQNHQPNSTMPSTWSIRRLRLSLQYHYTSKEFSWRFSLPTWYTQIIWEIQVARAISGWNFFIRKYTYRQWDSTVFKCVQAGNIEALQELFDRGEASLFDREFFSGSTLQHEALGFGRSKVSRFLTEQGLDVMEVDAKGQ